MVVLLLHFVLSDCIPSKIFHVEDNIFNVEEKLWLYPFCKTNVEHFEGL